MNLFYPVILTVIASMVGVIMVACIGLAWKRGTFERDLIARLDTLVKGQDDNNEYRKQTMGMVDKLEREVLSRKPGQARQA